MFRRAVVVAALLSSTACSDYEFTPATDVDAPPDDECPVEQASDFTPGATPDCAQEAIIGSFTPVVEWNNPLPAPYNQIMAAPAVANLTDDNGDGVVDRNDIPDIVFTAFTGSAYSSPGAIIALDGATGAVHWSHYDFGGIKPYASSGVALADLGDGQGMAVLVSATDGLLCLNGSNGTFRWHAEVPTDAYGHPAVADVDGDSVAEIVFGRQLIEADGDVRWSNGGGTRQDYNSFAMDLDDDGIQEIITGSEVFNADGSERWSDGDIGWPALGDMDGDGRPDVVRVHSGRVSVTDAISGIKKWEAGLADGGGGPPTVADFDGDGQAEIGVASREVYRVIDGNGSFLWSNTVQDFSSSRTGSSVFDFEGDGAAEVVYADEETLWVYDGGTGTVELQWDSHASGTLYEYPLVVDVDNDGSSEIVVASNNYSRPGSQGITVIGDQASSWDAARPVWNQHAYSVGNVDDDGKIPSGPTANWRAGNSFRAGNSHARTGLAQADLVLGDVDSCLLTCETRDTATIYVPVGNAGEADSVAVDVALYSVDGANLTLREQSAVDVVPAGATITTAAIELTRTDFGPDGLRIVVDDDGSGGGIEAECDESNNAITLADFPCP